MTMAVLVMMLYWIISGRSPSGQGPGFGPARSLGAAGRREAAAGRENTGPVFTARRSLLSGPRACSTRVCGPASRGEERTRVGRGALGRRAPSLLAARRGPGPAGLSRPGQTGARRSCRASRSEGWAGRFERGTHRGAPPTARPAQAPQGRNAEARRGIEPGASKGPRTTKRPRRPPSCHPRTRGSRGAPAARAGSRARCRQGRPGQRAGERPRAARGSGCLESLPILLSDRFQSSSGPAGGASDGYWLGRGAAGPDRWCTTTAAGTLRVIV